MDGFTLRHWILLFSLVSVISAVKWPTGTYTLVKPKSGCPSGWLEGWRYQDNEDEFNINSASEGHHFFGIIGQYPEENVNISYCTKDSSDPNAEGDWPSGNYCILRHGSTCPPGAFKNGLIFWDDEDDYNWNRAGGELPSGVFNHDTEINYCCRNDGLYTNKIRLPSSKPFYLLRYKDPVFRYVQNTHCQQVEGMNVREETIRTDDQDHGYNMAMGFYPWAAANHKTDHTLHYCYYWAE